MLLPAVLELLLLADSALPTGAFTASAGWETAVRDRRIAGAEDVARWMHGALEDAVGPLELPVVARATRSPSPGPASTLLDRRIPVAACSGSPASASVRATAPPPSAGSPAAPAPAP
jgi:urease accessory protein UreF